MAELVLEKSSQPSLLHFAGIIYGLTPWGLAQQLDLTVGAAQVSLGRAGLLIGSSFQTCIMANWATRGCRKAATGCLSQQTRLQ